VEHQVFVRRKICQAQGCTTIASFGVVGVVQTEQFCKAHMQEGMVRTATMGTSI